MINFNLDPLKAFCDSIKQELSVEATKRFCDYGNFLIAENEKMNLTAITEPDEIVFKHFLDCAMLLPVISPEHGASIADVGSGAGFPGMVIKILRPDLKLTMFDGLNKRVGFLNRLSDELGLEADAIHMRAEDAGKSQKYRESFSIATARAVARLNTLSEYCLPLVSPGGVFAAMKGPSAEEEAIEAESAFKILGGEKIRIKTDSLPDGSTRCFVLVKKISQTPPKYPRLAAKISKQPL